MVWWHNNWRAHGIRPLYEGNMANVHFVISWEKPEVKAVVASMQRGQERFARQARRPIIDACIALSHWSRNDRTGVEPLPEWSPSPYFNGIIDDIYVINVGWKHTLGCKVIQVTNAAIVPQGHRPARPHPPQADIIVRIQVELIQENPREDAAEGNFNEGEAEGEGAMEHVDEGEAEVEWADGGRRYGPWDADEWDLQMREA